MTGITGGGSGVGETPGIGEGDRYFFGSVSATASSSGSMSVVLDAFRLEGSISSTEGITTTGTLPYGVWLTHEPLQTIDMYLVNPVVYQTMTIQLVMSPGQKNPPVIATLLDAWTESLDLVWLKTRTMSYAMCIENAVTSDLDEWWGKLYNVHRRVLESDDDYRKRLQTYASILKGSGTKANVEDIVDHVLGEPGATALTTYWPGTVELNFSDTGSRIAKAKLPLLNYVLARALAAGITCRIPLPFVDYYIDMLVKGDIEAFQYMSLALGVPEVSYTLDTLVAAIKEYSLHNMDAMLMKEFLVSIRFSMDLQKECDFPYTMNCLMENNAERTYLMSSILKKNCSILQTIDQILLKDVSISMAVTAIVQGTHTISQRMDITLVETPYFNMHGVIRPTARLSGSLRGKWSVEGSSGSIAGLVGTSLLRKSIVGFSEATTTLTGTLTI
jgi:hypothetical protein